MHTLRTSITIDAPAALIWQILTDFVSFPRWNPFIREATGDLRNGGTVTTLAGPVGGTLLTASRKASPARA